MSPGRRQVAATALAVVTTALLGTGAAVARLHDKRPADLPKDPVASFTQDANGVHVRIHNANEHWTLRNQTLEIWLFADVGAPINNYGPDHESGDWRNPSNKIHCCLVPYLPPGGDFTFDLWPASHKVGGIRVIPNAGDGWIRT